MASRSRRRTLARALHENELQATIARYREHAAAIFKRLAELEADGNHDVEPLRRALVTCSDSIEGLACLVGATPANDDLDWLDAPTLPRKKP